MSALPVALCEDKRDLVSSFLRRRMAGEIERQRIFIFACHFCEPIRL